MLTYAICRLWAARKVGASTDGNIDFGDGTKLPTDGRPRHGLPCRQELGLMSIYKREKFKMNLSRGVPLRKVSREPRRHSSWAVGGAVP